MKKRYLFIVFILIFLPAAILLFYLFKPETRIVGTWQGDGTLEVLGDSSFDGATEIIFYADNSGSVTTDSDEAEFKYSFASSPHSDILVVETSELTYALRYDINGDKLVLNDVVFIKIE